MANPQRENGHIDIANEIAEALAKTQLSGYENRVLWVILRKTWGYVARDKEGNILRDKNGNMLKKTEDRISITQFSEMTKLDRRNVKRTLDRLISRNIIFCKRNGYIYTYGFNKDYDKWITVVKNDNKLAKIQSNKGKQKSLSKSTTSFQKTRNKENLEKLVVENDNKSDSLLKSTTNSLSKSTPTKEKRNIGKISYRDFTGGKKKRAKKPAKKTNPDIKKFIDAFHNGYKETFGEAPHIVDGKDGDLVGKMLRTHKLEFLISLLPYFWRLQDKLIDQTGHTIGVFKIRLNKLIELRKRDKKVDVSWLKKFVEEEQG